MNETGKPVQNPIGRRLIKQIILLILFLTFLLTAIEGWLDYHRRLEGIHETMEQVKQIQGQGITTALWHFDKQTLSAQVQGILHFPYLSYAAIRDQNKVILEAGKEQGQKIYVRKFPLIQDHNGRRMLLGSLYLQADTTKVMADVFGRIAEILLLQVATVAFVAFILFLLFQRLVTRHLSTMADYFRSFDIADPNRPLQLHKKKYDDEIDTLVQTVNTMRENLAAASQRQLLVQQKIEESEARFRLLVEQAPEAIVVFDVGENRFVQANANAERLFGCSRDELLKRGPQHFYAPIQPDGRPIEESFKENIERVLAGEKLVLERLIQTADGKDLICEVWLVRLPSAERKLIRNSYIDVTERKQSEEEREISAGFLHLINESKTKEEVIRGAVAFFQKQSGCEAVGIRLKEGDDYPYYEVSGFPRDFIRAENSLCARDAAGQVIRDLAGLPLIECMCGNVIMGRSDPAKSYFTSEGSFWSNCTTELLATTSEKDRLARTRNRCNGAGYESVALIPLRYRQERLGLLQMNDRRKGVFSRKTMGLWERLAGYLAVAIVRFQAEEEIRRLNAELDQRVQERTAQLETVNRELETFSYSVSHDLRAPLRHLTGFVGLLNEQLSDGLDEKSRHYMQVISNSALKMARLIDDILSFSRMGRMEMMRSRVNMATLLEEILKMIQPECKDRKMVWSIGELPEVYGDPPMLKTVWTNLVLNAVKFTRQKPEARIEIGAIQAQPGEDVFYIKDNGAGFDMEYADKLFGIFQRLHREEEFEGTGIGLANVQRIIHRHGGRTWAEGAVNQGAQFYFSLPKRKESP